MEQFHHPHVISLLGVCLDSGPGVSIVMPFMANGSLLDYLKKERRRLDMSFNSDNEEVIKSTTIIILYGNGNYLYSGVLRYKVASTLCTGFISYQADVKNVQ